MDTKIVVIKRIKQQNIKIFEEMVECVCTMYTHTPILLLYIYICVQYICNVHVYI